jgi:LAS superfamily LD-carboxypeptidase LdcB
VALELEAIAAEKSALAAKNSVAGLERLAVESGIAVDHLDEVAGAHTRMGASGMIAEHVIRAFSDSVSAGQSPARAFAMELPRITEALQFLALETNATEGALGKFASFMGGPWGLVISLGTAVLAPLVAELAQNKEAADEAAKSTRDYAKEQDGFADAIDKANGKLVERNRLLSAIALQEKAPEIARQEAAARDFSSQAFALAAGARGSKTPVYTAGGSTAPKIDPALDRAITAAGGDVIKLRNNLDELAKAAKGDQREAIRSLADQVNHLAGQSIAASKQADTLRGKANEVATALRGGRVLTTEGVQRQIEEKNATTPLEKARIQLREVTDRKADLDATPYGPAQQAALKKWSADLDAATEKVKRLEAAQREGREGRQVGRQIDLSQAERIVQAVGGRITSSYRSTAEQQVLYDRYRAGTGSLAAKPGTSEHERGQALDVAKSAGVTLAVLKKAFEDAGVKLTEALDEGNHFHVAWGPKGPSADALGRRQRAEADKAANQDGAYQSEVRAALAALAAAKEKLPQTPEQRYQTTSTGLEDDFIQRSAALEDQVTAHKLSAAEAAYLLSLAYAREQLDLEGAGHKLLADKLDRAARDQEASTAARIGLLQARLGVTDDPQTRRSIASEILDKRQQAERDALQKRIDNEPNDHDDAARARAALPDLLNQQGYERDALNRQYASPLEAKRLQLQQSVGSIGDDVEKIQSDAIDHLGDSLESAALKGLKLHGLLGSIAGDLIKLAIEREVELPLANALTGKSGGGGGIFSAIAGLFGGGRAVGGGVSGSQFYLVGEKGPELFAPGRAGTIVPNHVLAAGVPSMPSLSRMDVSSLSRRQPVEVTISAEEGALFRPTVSKIAGEHVQRAAPTIANGGAQMAEGRRQRSERYKL